MESNIRAPDLWNLPSHHIKVVLQDSLSTDPKLR